MVQTKRSTAVPVTENCLDPKVLDSVTLRLLSQQTEINVPHSEYFLHIKKKIKYFHQIYREKAKHKFFFSVSIQNHNSVRSETMVMDVHAVAIQFTPRSKWSLKIEFGTRDASVVAIVIVHSTRRISTMDPMAIFTVAAVTANISVQRELDLEWERVH